MDCSTTGFPVLHYLPEFAQTHLSILSMMLSSCLILCHPFSSCPQSFPASGSFPMSRDKYTDLSSEYQLKTLKESVMRPFIAWHGLPITFLDRVFEHGSHDVRRCYLNSLEGLEDWTSTKQRGYSRWCPRHIQFLSSLVIFLC